MERNLHETHRCTGNLAAKTQESSFGLIPCFVLILAKSFHYFGENPTLSKQKTYTIKNEKMEREHKITCIHQHKHKYPERGHEVKGNENYLLNAARVGIKTL